MRRRGGFLKEVPSCPHKNLEMPKPAASTFYPNRKNPSISLGFCSCASSPEESLRAINDF